MCKSEIIRAPSATAPIHPSPFPFFSEFFPRFHLLYLLHISGHHPSGLHISVSAYLSTHSSFLLLPSCPWYVILVIKKSLREKTDKKRTMTLISLIITMISLIPRLQKNLPDN